MNGAESLLRTLIASGVDVCFANPGTSEMHFVEAVDRVQGMRTVLGLFEGVVTGAADGYGRMTGKPAVTLLHLGPGLANGLANLHNARRADSPIVNIVGDHATYHLQYDAPLTSDIVGFARPVSSWVHSSMSALTVASDGARAVRAALEAPGKIATLIVPANVAWGDAERPAAPLPRPAAAEVASDVIDEAAKAILNGKKTALLLKGDALTDRELVAAGRIAAKTGVRLMCDFLAPKLRRGAGLVPVERLPYHADWVIAFMCDVEQLLLVGSKPPISFFADPDKPSWLLPEGCKLVTVSHPHENGVAALEALASTLGAGPDPIPRTELVIPDLPTGKLDATVVGQIIARFMPDETIISDESSTAVIGLTPSLMNARPHDHLVLTGGSIGQAMPLAVGAAVGCPDRKVLCLQGDGGGMYTVQALWTQARENLDVTTVIFANRSYAILQIELARLGVWFPGPRAKSMLDLHNPTLNWVQIANGLGVEASCARTTEEFAAQFQSAIGTRGPRLIEVILDEA